MHFWLISASADFESESRSKKDQANRFYLVF